MLLDLAQGPNPVKVRFPLNEPSVSWPEGLWLVALPALAALYFAELALARQQLADNMHGRTLELLRRGNRGERASSRAPLAPSLVHS